MSNIGQPASGAGILYWNGSVLRWSGAPTTGYVPYWTGSAISWAEPPASLYGRTDTSLYYNTYLGYLAGQSSGASYSVAVGYHAGYSAGSSSDYSTYVGSEAGYDMGGEGCVAFGYKAGQGYSYGDYNILIGINTQVASSSNTHSIVIGSGSAFTGFDGKGSYSTRIGELSINDVWICGDTFHFGDETATGDKFWFFTRSSAASGHPGFKWNETDDQIEFSNNGTDWTPLGGGGGGTLDIVYGEYIQADDPVFIDEGMDGTATPKVYKCEGESQGLSGGITIEGSGSWSAPTQPYAYDAIALRGNLYIVAYRYGTSLRLRAIEWNEGAGASIGTPVDLSPDGGSNEVAYISLVRITAWTHSTPAFVVAWVNPTTNTGYLATVSVSGTNTLTAGTPITFTTTGCLGTALAEYVSATTPTSGICALAWADVASDTGLSRMVGSSGLGTTNTTSLYGSSDITFTTMAAASIGQPTFRGTYSYGASIMYGVNERRMRFGVHSSASPYINWYTAGNESRIDSYGHYSGAPGYVLDAAQYGTGDFFHARGACALIVTGTRTGFEEYIYLVDSTGSYYGMPQQNTKVIGGGIAGVDYGSAVSLLTLRTVGTDCFMWSAVTDTGVAKIKYGMGYKHASTGLQVNFGPTDDSWGFTPVLGAQPQHPMQFFRITDHFVGALTSIYYSSNDSLRLYRYRLADARIAFDGMARTTGSAGTTNTITLPGGVHTFTSLGAYPLIPGRKVYMDGETSGYSGETNFNKTEACVGVALTATDMLVKRPQEAG